MRLLWLTPIALSLLAPVEARAMCGGMFPVRPPQPPRTPTEQLLVAQRIVNRASKVALVREGDRTILTMSNDVATDAAEFGLVVPVPTVITQKDVRVVDVELFNALERATNPQLKEQVDPDPCPEAPGIAGLAMAPSAKGAGGGGPARPAAPRAADFGVKVEAHYDVGEYGIAILSAKEGAGGGLVEWLNRFHYDVPKEAIPILDSYIKQNMRFFVAKVNLKKRVPGTFLRPIQVSYSTPRFMLPVRLGTINADGPQELVVYAFSQKGRIEATNYRTVKLPTGLDLPLFVKDELDQTLKAIFDAQTKKEDMRAIFLEHARTGSLERELNALLGLPGGAAVTATRLHFRYDRDHFPEDVVFQETPNREPFSIIHTVHHPAENTGCPAGQSYLASLGSRRDREAQNLATVTGQELAAVRRRLGIDPGRPAPQALPTEADYPARLKLLRSLDPEAAQQINGDYVAAKGASNPEALRAVLERLEAAIAAAKSKK